MASTESDLRQSHIETLRGEARLLTAAGAILLGVSFPLTLLFVGVALAGHSPSPFMPIVAGGPPILVGYLACHIASRRMARANALDAG